MKHFILILTGIFSFLSLNAQDKKILVAYFSCTGTTETAAQTIAAATGGDLYRIAPEKAYSAADLDWKNEQSRSSKEMNDDACRPSLADRKAKVEKYDLIFIGFPIWWNTCPRIINTFLESYDFKDKTVVPFATSGGSSITNGEEQLRKLYGKGIKWKPGRLCNDGTDSIKSWARKISR